MTTAKYITSKIDNIVYCQTNGQFTKHLRKNNLTYQQYYEQYVTGIVELCDCSNPKTFYQKTLSYATTCGDPVCVGKQVSTTKKSWTRAQKQRDSKNKSAAAALHTDNDIKQTVDKARQTFMKRYGVEWGTQSDRHKDKSKKTKLERYGNEYYANSKQTSKSWQAKTADDIDVIVNKRRATCLDRFGVENAFLKPEVKTNSAKSNSLGREFTLPSGRVIRIRGYEDIAITKLLETYIEDQLIVDNRMKIYSLPVFTYNDKSKHNLRYYPDIYIAHENKIIEVKSRWWWDGNGINKYKNRLAKNLNKRKAVLNAGYNYEVWLFEDKNNYKVLKYDSNFAQ
jgi:hypothetical protein